jgi:hypothetical protein
MVETSTKTPKKFESKDRSAVVGLKRNNEILTVTWEFAS